LTAAINRFSNVIEHIFDRLGRETEELWKNALGDTKRTITYGYDAAGQMISADDCGARD
jgi:hypothetical protein